MSSFLIIWYEISASGNKKGIPGGDKDTSRGVEVGMNGLGRLTVTAIDGVNWQE